MNSIQTTENSQFIISLRQQYAMAAMQGLIAHYGFVTAPDAALQAFEIADAMIRHEEDEREDKESGELGAAYK